MLEKFFGNKKTAVVVKKVLIVEDDYLLAKVLSESFLNEKFKVATIDDGTKVLETAKEFSPDIILLDLILPGIDGFAVLKQLKDDIKTKNIAVLVLSNLSDVGDVKSVKALGADDYFIKSNTEMKEIIDYVKNKLKV